MATSEIWIRQILLICINILTFDYRPYQYHRRLYKILLTKRKGSSGEPKRAWVGGVSNHGFWTLLLSPVSLNFPHGCRVLCAYWDTIPFAFEFVTLLELKNKTRSKTKVLETIGIDGNPILTTFLLQDHHKIVAYFQGQFIRT